MSYAIPDMSYPIPDSSCAGTKTISVGAFIWSFLCSFCNGAQYMVLQADEQSHCGYATNKNV